MKSVLELEITFLCENVQTESHIFHSSLKQLFQSPNANMATFTILRHPVTILITAFTKADKYDQ